MKKAMINEDHDKMGLFVSRGGNVGFYWLALGLVHCSLLFK